KNLRKHVVRLHLGYSQGQRFKLWRKLFRRLICLQPQLAVLVPQGLVPKLEAIALTDQHRGARQAGVLAQARRDQDATAAVELEVGRVTDHQTLQTARDGIERRQTAQLELDLFPLGQRIDEQATIGAIHGCDQTPIGALDDAL